MKNPKFFYTEDDNSVLCVIQDKNKTYYGTAKCASEDMDMQSNKVGAEISMRRATISALKGKKEELKLKKQGLLEFYYDVIYNKNYNDKDFLAKRLKRKINNYIKDIDTITQLILEEQEILKEYIENKDKFYKQIRERRQSAKSN